MHVLRISFFISLCLSFMILGCSEAPGSETTSASESEVEVGDNAPNEDPLPSWNAGDTKSAIMEFVSNAVEEGGAGFIPEKDRIATFDNDGCLWSEQPVYFQLAYAIDYIKKNAPDHPDWKDKQPYKAILEDDMQTALSGGEKALVQLVMASHAGMTSEEFQSAVNEWLQTAKHPKTGLAYNTMIFQPMVELLEYLRANGFKTFIVSGGGIDFMRVWVEEAYGIPPYQVVGSSIKTQYEERDGKPFLVKLPELNFIDDKEGKPVGIHQHIGKRPVFAAGNSDGDYQMLKYTTTADGYPRFGLLIHHTDAEREWAYDRDSHIGTLAKGLDDADKYNWTVVDMKQDWNTIYPDGK